VSSTLNVLFGLFKHLIVLLYYMMFTVWIMEPNCIIVIIITATVINSQGKNDFSALIMKPLLRE
jgi:hypothetical protein